MPPTPASSSVGLDISSIVDGVYYGVLVSIFLLGISIVQGWSYFHNNQDKWGLRALVGITLSLNFAKSWADSGILHHYLISNFGNVNTLHVNSPFFSIDFVITSIVMFLVQLFFAVRIYLLTKNRWATGLVLFFSVVMMILGVVSLAEPNLYADDFLQTSSWIKVKREITVAHVIGTIADVVITVILCYTFFKSKRATSFKSTKLILKHLLVFIVSRGILITLVQTAHLTMFAVNPTNILFWSSLHMSLSHLYVIIMLVMLNARPSAGGVRDGDLSPGSVHFAHSLVVTGAIGTRITLPAASIASTGSTTESEEPSVIDCEPKAEV